MEKLYGREWVQKLPVEWVCWVSALVLLYAGDPQTHHFTLCPLENAGIGWCPGCGLGRSITLFMHGEIGASFKLHWLGIPAFFVILHRIVSLSKQTYHHWITFQHHEQP